MLYGRRAYDKQHVHKYSMTLFIGCKMNGERFSFCVLKQSITRGFVDT